MIALIITLAFILFLVPASFAALVLLDFEDSGDDTFRDDSDFLDVEVLR